jgi:hypothetical protein
MRKILNFEQSWNLKSSKFEHFTNKKIKIKTSWKPETLDSDRPSMCGRPKSDVWFKWAGPSLFQDGHPRRGSDPSHRLKR